MPKAARGRFTLLASFPKERADEIDESYILTYTTALGLNPTPQLVVEPPDLLVQIKTKCPKTT